MPDGVASSENDAVWEFRFDSDEAERLDAARRYERIVPPPLWTRIFAPLIGWAIVACMLGGLLWAAVAAAALAERMVGFRFDPDGAALLALVVSAFVAVMLVRGMVWIARSFRPTVSETRGTVRFHSDGRVTFSEDVGATYRVGRYDSDDRFHFFTLDGGRKFVSIAAIAIEAPQREAFHRFAVEMARPSSRRPH